MKRLRRRRRCAWPGCQDKPLEVGSSGMCRAHAARRDLDELASAYSELATKLGWMSFEAAGWPETAWPEKPGPVELRRLATDSAMLARQCRQASAQLDLPERRKAQEIPMGPEELKKAHSRQIVEEGLLELWPGRPSTHARHINQEQWTQLTAVLGLLARTERKAYYLVHGQGMTHRQAARDLKTTAGNVYNLLRRADEKIEAWRSGGETAQATLF